MALHDYYYWCDGEMTANDLDEWFNMVEFDELGYSEDYLTDDELEDEILRYAYENEIPEAEAREYLMARLVTDDERDYRWEKYLQGERLRG